MIGSQSSLNGRETALFPVKKLLISMHGIMARSRPASIKAKYTGLYPYASCKTVAQLEEWKNEGLPVERTNSSHPGW
jgi:hypothetical protein